MVYSVLEIDFHEMFANHCVGKFLQISSSAPHRDRRRPLGPRLREALGLEQRAAALDARGAAGALADLPCALDAHFVGMCRNILIKSEANITSGVGPLFIFTALMCFSELSPCVRLFFIITKCA